MVGRAARVEPAAVPADGPVALGDHAPAEAREPAAQPARRLRRHVRLRVVVDDRAAAAAGRGRRRRLRALVEAPVADELGEERGVACGPVLREKADVLHVEAARPDRDLREVALEVVRARVAAEVGAQQHRRRRVRLLRAAHDLRAHARVDVDAHGNAVVRRHHRVPLVRRDRVGRRHDPRLDLALEDDSPLAVEAQPVFARHAAVELGDEDLVAVPLRGALLVAWRQDRLRARLDEKVRLDRERRDAAKRKVDARVLDLRRKGAVRGEAGVGARCAAAGAAMRVCAP